MTKSVMISITSSKVNKFLPAPERKFCARGALICHFFRFCNTDKQVLHIYKV